MSRPLGVEGLVACRAFGDGGHGGTCQAGVVVPSDEGISSTGGVVQRDGCCLYIVRGRVGCGHATAIEAVGDAVGDDVPLGVEGHGALVGSGEVVDALLVGITGAAAIGQSVPACKVVARAGEGVGREVLRCAIGESHVAHRAVGTAIAIELHGIGVVFQFGRERHVAVAYSKTVAVEGSGASLVDGMLTSGYVEISGERQCEALAVVGLVVIDEAVGDIGGGGQGGGGRADAAHAAAHSHLAGMADVGAGTHTDSVVTVAAIEVEVLEGAVIITANDGAF